MLSPVQRNTLQIPPARVASFGSAVPTWQVNFGGQNLDLRQYKFINHIDHPKYDVVYYDPRNVQVTQGQLGTQLRLKLEPIAHKVIPPDAILPEKVRYSSGRVEYPLNHFKKGQIDITASMPLTPGVFPVLALFREDNTWPPMVVVGTFHGQRSLQSQTYQTAYPNFPLNPNTDEPLYHSGQAHHLQNPTAPHTYSIRLTDHELIWLLDGREVRREAKPAEFNANWKIWVFLRAGDNAIIPGIGDPGYDTTAEMVVHNIQVTPAPTQL